MESSIEAKLKEQESKLGLLSRGLIDVMWVIDLETMKYTYISPSVESIRGFTAEEVMALPVKKHMTEESYNNAMAHILDGLDKFETNPDLRKVFEVEMFHKDGSTVWFEINARLAREKDGRVKAVGVTKDISQRKSFEKEKDELIVQLKDALEEQKRLHQEIKVLRGLLPICADCKKIRDDEGKWWPDRGVHCVKDGSGFHSHDLPGLYEESAGCHS